MNNSKSLKGFRPDATIGQLINADKNAGELLASIGLTPENHQSETLQAVCLQKQWDEVEVLEWLKKNQQINGVRNYGNDKDKNKGELPDSEKNVQKCCEYLEQHFLTKNTELLNDINRNFPRVHKIHGNQYGWLKNMHWYLEKLEKKLNSYFYFERHKFFPLLDRINNSKMNVLDDTVKKVDKGITIIEEDQGVILDLINTVEEKGQGLKNPEGACSTLRILNHNIKTLFSSLRKQIELERQHIIPPVKRKLESA